MGRLSGGTAFFIKIKDKRYKTQENPLPGEPAPLRRGVRGGFLKIKEPAD